MACIVFHGSADDKACYKAARALAKKWGGKFSYNSFYNGREKRWFSDDTIGKAAYCVVVSANKYKSQGPRSELASLIREARKFSGAIRFTHFY